MQWQQAGRPSMSETLLRPGGPEDLPAIAELLGQVFGSHPNPESLRWILQDPEHPGALSSHTAWRDGELVGHVAFVRTRHQLDGRDVVNVHPILWARHLTERGRFIRDIYHQVLDRGDVSIIYEGTQSARAVYPKFGYQPWTEVGIYRRFLSLPGRPAPLSRLRPWLRTGKAGLGWLEGLAADAGGRLRRRLGRPMELMAQPAEPGAEVIAPAAAPVTTQVPPASCLTWLDASPVARLGRHTLRWQNQPAGDLLTWSHQSYARGQGQLLHIPLLGEDPAAYAAAIKAGLDDLRQQGCQTALAMASRPALAASLRRSGFRRIASRPVWLYDPRELLRSQPVSLSYLEGDAAFRAL